MELYAAGARVAHGEYGDGTVMRADEYHTVIQFDEHGLRTFSSPRVVLRSTNTLAPPPAKGRRKRVVKATTKTQAAV